MKLFARLKTSCYCAFCRSGRTIYAKKHLDLVTTFLIFVFSGLVGSAIWDAFDPRAILVLAITLTGGELFIYLRWRFSVTCHQCGFDPVLYKKSPPRASQKVSDFYAEKIKDPQFLMGASPLVDWHRRCLQVERRNKWITDRTPVPVESPKAIATKR